eukprot:CAMPEP_0172301608 /NCGR_PEP_ID=MMETSP1058-20130122/3456_1 /TAXON_ID=83371 /ORGANISM="Detonula confervacea, Strain CCMP 353" /LENGTH=316 /DNA_ID=CAMNT_0013011781 /DNA_START=115 /DNA_END=1065 /DNA_ORIENTATION=+
MAKLVFKQINKRVATETHQQRNGRITQVYNILPQITGYGIAGEVRQCIHLPTSQIRAVKTITKSRIQRKDKSQIEREISFLKKVQHPNIIELYDIYEDRDEVHIVMELCHGGELFDKIIEKAELNNGNQVPAQLTCFAEKDAARIIHSLLSAVSYLHSKDVVHRDIKPENILFTEKDNNESPIKLIDFGLSIEHTHNCSPLTKAVGTSYYMAPELLDGSYDRSCDLWAIGVIAYIMLSGEPPFDGSTDDDIFKEIRKGRYKIDNSRLWDDGVSEYAKDFIRCLLDIDPHRRWSADMALEHAWFKLANVDAEFVGGS